MPVATARFYLHAHGDQPGGWVEPGQDVPDDVAARLDNPTLWAQPPGADNDPAPGGVEGPTTPPEADGPEIPPKGGPGATKAAWAAYARAHGVDLEPGASRDDIIRAVEDAGVPTEE